MAIRSVDFDLQECVESECLAIDESTDPSCLDGLNKFEKSRQRWMVDKLLTRAAQMGNVALVDRLISIISENIQ